MVKRRVKRGGFNLLGALHGGITGALQGLLGGRRKKVRRVRRRVRGKGIVNTLKKIHNYVKAEKLISKAASHFGHPKVAAFASKYGYGRRRRSRRGRGGVLIA